MIDERVIEAMRRVPRHKFIPESQRGRAHEDVPLPIGYGQTISQPYVVALMTHLADIQPGTTVLEVGTGSGYQAAVLAELGAQVWTIEIVTPLGQRAAATLAALGYTNIHTRIGDGYGGWPEAAPFERVLVTAAPETIPPPLIEQLAPGGRMVIPVGKQDDTQDLQLLTRDAEGELTVESVLPVRFVPFTGAG